jgi:hypothetical protein
VPKRSFELYHGDELVARLHPDGHDWPWTLGRLEPLAGFDALRPLFASAEPNSGEHGIRLVDPKGRAVPFLLHIEGENAWWR